MHCVHCNPCESRAANSRSLSAHKRVCALGWVTICQTLSIVFVYILSFIFSSDSAPKSWCKIQFIASVVNGNFQYIGKT